MLIGLGVNAWLLMGIGGCLLSICSVMYIGLISPPCSHVKAGDTSRLWSIA